MNQTQEENDVAVVVFLDQTFRSETLVFKYNQSRFYNLILQFIPQVPGFSILLEDEPELLLESFISNKSPYIPQRYKNDLDFLRKACNANCNLIKDNEIMMNDKECCKIAASQEGFPILYYCKQKCVEVLLEAFKKTPDDVARNYGFSLSTTPEYKEWLEKKEKQQAVIPTTTTTSSSSTSDENILLSEKELMLKSVKINGYHLRNFPLSALDRDVVLEAIKQNGSVYQILDEKWRNELEIVEAALDKDPLNLRFVPNQFRTDESLVMKAVTKDGFALKYAHPKFQKDKEIVLNSFTTNGKAVEFVHKSLWKDESIVRHAMQKTGRAMFYASESLKSDREYALQIVHKFAESFHYLSNSLKSDLDFILSALQKNALIFHYINPKLKQERSFLLEALNRNSLLFEYLPESDKKNPKLVIAACKKSQFLGDFLSSYPRFSKDHDFIIECVRVNGFALGEFSIDKYSEDVYKKFAFIASSSLFQHKYPNR